MAYQVYLAAEGTHWPCLQLSSKLRQAARSNHMASLEREQRHFRRQRAEVPSSPCGRTLTCERSLSGIL